MKVQPLVRIPLVFDRLSPLSILGDPRITTEYANFRIVACSDKRSFYECDAGCIGAGLPSFDADTLEIPEDVLEQMKIHAHLCDALHQKA